MGPPGGVAHSQRQQPQHRPRTTRTAPRLLPKAPWTVEHPPTRPDGRLPGKHSAARAATARTARDRVAARSPQTRTDAGKSRTRRLPARSPPGGVAHSQRQQPQHRPRTTRTAPRLLPKAPWTVEHPPTRPDGRLPGKHSAARAATARTARDRVAARSPQTRTDAGKSRTRRLPARSPPGGVAHSQRQQPQHRPRTTRTAPRLPVTNAMDDKRPATEPSRQIARQTSRRARSSASGSAS